MWTYWPRTVSSQDRTSRKARYEGWAAVQSARFARTWVSHKLHAVRETIRVDLLAADDLLTCDKANRGSQCTTQVSHTRGRLSNERTALSTKRCPLVSIMITIDNPKDGTRQTTRRRCLGAIKEVTCAKHHVNTAGGLSNVQTAISTK